MLAAKKLRTKGNRWCEVKIELRDKSKGPELAISGAAGRTVGDRAAKREALQYWVDYFDDNPGEIQELNRRFGRRFTSARGAAKFVLECDGDYHGVDVHATTGDRVLVTECCGQIREEIGEFFPELASLFPWHLNGMHSGCVHQHLQGKTYQTDPGARCGNINCAHIKLGHGWYHWPLPERVIGKVEAIIAEYTAK